MKCAICEAVDAPLYPFGNAHVCSLCLNRQYRISKEIAAVKAVLTGGKDNAEWHAAHRS